MKHVLYINNLTDLETNYNSKFDRIYFGTEFCERLIPNVQDIQKAIEFSKNNKINFSLITPWCTNKGIKKIKNILELLPEDTEVIFNDWGVFNLIKEKKLKPIIGRLLIKIRRDPCLNQENDNIDFFKYCNLNSISFQEFLIKNKIYRVELDNVLQGYSFNLNNNIKTSLHYPFIFISGGKKCLLAGCNELKEDSKVRITDCKRECKEYLMLGNMKNVKKNIILKGNSHFYFNDRKPDNIEKYNTDRMIFCPKLPF